jgi:surface protein
MFYKSLFNGDISKWDVSKVENMSWMFAHSKFDNNLADWDVSSVKNMAYMFSGRLSCHCGLGTPFNRDISRWNVSNVTNMEDMFSYSNFSGNIDNWKPKKETNKNRMFWNSPLEFRHPKWYQPRDGVWFVKKYKEDSTLNSIIKNVVERIYKIKNETGIKVGVDYYMLAPYIADFIVKDCQKNNIDTDSIELEYASDVLAKTFIVEYVQKEKEQAKIKQMLTSDAEDNQAST